MKMPIGDIVDRYSICKLKSERLDLDNIKELKELNDEIIKYNDIDLFIDKLYKINGKIWDLESDIRKGNEKLLGLEEIGKRALKIRDFNNIRVSIKNDINSKYNEGFIEVKMNHGSEKNPSLIITLTTVPERLNNDKEDGLKLVIKSLCEQEDNDYEVHFNIPKIYTITNTPYIIPEWLNNLKLKYKHLKIFRTIDYGPPTKFYPTLKRVKDSETILLVVDDDLVYHQKMVSEHKKYQNKLPNSVICYDGRGSKPLYNDLRDSWVICVTQVIETYALQHYKSASYKVKLFNEEFDNYYLGKTLSDDVLVSHYFKNNNIPMYVVPYENDNMLYETKELWDKNQGVETFPILRYASSVDNTGCNHPNMLKKQPKFYVPSNLGEKNNLEDVNIKKYDTDKFSHGYIPFYQKVFNKISNCVNILEIGVYMGESLKLLSDFFPNATVYGLDINDKSEYDCEKIKTLIGDQEKREDLNKIKENFDLILDDGGHTMKQQQISFAVLFKKLKSNGVYIIEDLHTSDKEPWMNENDKISTLNMLKEFEKNNKIISNHISDEEKEYLEKNIKSITIWSNDKNYKDSITSIIIKK